MTKPLIVVTGASSGIGASIAKSFAKSGHALLLLARDLKAMEDLKLDNAICKSVDVTNAQALQDAIKQAEEVYGKTECIVNCAGLMLLGDIENQEKSEWQKMFDVNVIGLLNGMQAVLSDMKARNSGTIINISSIAGKKTFPAHAAYCGTKFAVHAISENVREEVADTNVRVITIAPGAVETPLLSHTTSQEIKDNYDVWKESMGGVLNPQDIADCVLFAFNQPQNVCVREIAVTATRQQP
jgi:NADP-dependent 3-hydroxy acid dehydrogenase YdfG